MKSICKYLHGMIYFCIFACPYLVMDLVTRSVGITDKNNPLDYYAATIYTFVWIVLIFTLAYCLGKKIGRIFYWLSFAIFYILFLTNNIYFALTKVYFNFSLLEMTDEGTSYIWDVVKSTNGKLIALAVVLLVVEVLLFRKFPFPDKIKIGPMLPVILCFLMIQVLVPKTFGAANKKLKWNSFKNDRDIYNNFSDMNKCMNMTGLYEYSARNFYVLYVRPKEKISEKDKNFLDQQYLEEDKKKKDKYTGIFKGKNVIFLQLEGMDNWLLTKETTPNLYNMMQHSINFTNHYSLYTGGGSTFNSEFAVNTGFTTPITYSQNVYTLNNNRYKETLPKLFKADNYRVNAFHMNSSEYYSRGVNYNNWGYDHYFGMKDQKNYDPSKIVLDRELMLNKSFDKEMFGEEGKFLNYIITYTPHTPFTTKKKVGKIVAELKYGKGKAPKLPEEDVARLDVNETDYMVGLLLDKLKEKGLYDNTVIVAYADHYLYTIKNKSILDKYKTTDNNLINNTPFFIWSSDVKPVTIDKVTMQMNILPTVLNLFGIDYGNNDFLCKNALADDYEGIAFFSDHSWYDGNVYVEEGKVTNGAKISEQELEKKNQYVDELIKKNDLTLKYNYWKK